MDSGSAPRTQQTSCCPAEGGSAAANTRLLKRVVEAYLQSRFTAKSPSEKALTYESSFVNESNGCHRDRHLELQTLALVCWTSTAGKVTA